MQVSDLSIETLRHAYVLAGDAKACTSAVADLLARCGIETAGNPDVHFLAFDTLTIGDARELIALCANRPVAGGRRIVVLTCRGLTVEAQNALLKLFEEPPAGTVLFLNTPYEETLLPTLRSRGVALALPRERAASTGDTEHFLKATPAERLALVGTIVERKDKTKARELIGALARHFHERLQKNPHDAETRRALHMITTAETYLDDRAASLKLLLESLCATLPRI